MVQPSTYGTDNSCTLDGMAQLGAATTRGVAVVDTSVTDAELKRLHGLGIRGIRFNLVQAGATTVEMLEPLSKRVNDLGWHVQIHQTGDGIVKMGRRAAEGRLADRVRSHGPHPEGRRHRASGLHGDLKLIDKGHTWVKISGAYMDTKVGPPTYADFDQARAGLREARAAAHGVGQRLAASDREGRRQAERRDPGRPVVRMGPDEATRNRILVDNPAALYGFGRAG